MIEFFSKLFSSSEFMPHGHCIVWKPEVLWLHVGSDVVTAIAYYTIPFCLITLVVRRRDLAFNWVILMFGVFILACGTTHIIDAYTMWRPMYRFEGVVKLITAIASIATAIALWPLIPKVLAIPTTRDLEKVNADLKSLTEDLDLKVQKRTKEITQFNQMAIGREKQMVELKRTINKLSQELGRDPVYDLTFADQSK